ncbi:MAG TPA: pentapeptide repeat-containing protein [Candidatus Sulfotelmatobacter sp.]
MNLTPQDTEQLRRIAFAIIEGGPENSSAQKGAELLRLVSEIEKQGAEARKLVAEELKINDERKETRADKRHRRIKDYIALLAPLFTTVVLAATLIQQSWQFVRSEQAKRAEFIQSERDKDAETRRQADAAEDLRWADSVKLLSQSEKLSPAGVILKSFAKSDRYGGLASQMAMQLLVRTDDPTMFADLFNLIFEPISWGNVRGVIELDRNLTGQANPLFTKSWNPKTMANDYSKLSDPERKQVSYLGKDLSLISGKLSALLKGQRPSGEKLDLRSITLYEDFRGADFSGADITGSTLTGIDVKGADFSGVTGYTGATFSGTAWWKAARIDHDMLRYLEAAYPYSGTAQYYWETRPSKGDYDSELRRLQGSPRPGQQAFKP